MTAGERGAGPSFSVLVGTYNQAAYLGDALDSVRAQSFGDYEIVVVDDGSTDDTQATLERWCGAFRRDAPDRRVSVLRVANGGQSAALEHGFGLCTGRYICLLDSDDRWLPHKLAAVFDAVAKDPGAGMIVHPLYVIDAEGRRTGDVRPKHARLSEGDLRDLVTRTGRHVAPATSGVVIRSDVFESLLPMPTKGFRSGADSYLTFGASLRAPVRVIPDPCGEYRIHADSHYLGRMLSPEGLERSVALQRTIAEHFGLAAVVGGNSFFARNLFALAKLRGGVGQQSPAFVRLTRATIRDPAFSRRGKVLLLGYWLVCLLAPRAVFRRLWRAFQLRQTGYGKVLSRPSAARSAGRRRRAPE
jgi:glycosyltransferase involved in cell wall biosynthesis